MKTERRCPKVGEKVRLTDRTLTLAKKEGHSYNEYLCDKLLNRGTLKVTKIIENGSILKQIWTDESPYSEKAKKDILPGDECLMYLVDGYKCSLNDKDTFIEVVIDDEIIAEFDDEIYCKCTDPKLITNWADGKQFSVCKKCGKESITCPF